MANKLTSEGTLAPNRPYLNGMKRPLSWIKRRARSLERAYVVPRRIALLNARIDWAHFNPVATYPLAGRKAPLHLGHQPDGAPSIGTVQSLTVKDHALVATAEVSDQLTQLVKDSAFKKVSSAFYAPGNAENPYPAAWTLRHVAFLGAHPPAVKGLQPLNFMEFADNFSIDLVQPAINLLSLWWSIKPTQQIADELQAINPGMTSQQAVQIVLAGNAFLSPN